MISTRAFVTAVVVLWSMTWLVLRVSSPAPLADLEAHLRWIEFQEVNTCLVNGAELFEQRYADYRALIARPLDQWPINMGFAGFGMGTGGSLRAQSTEPSPCKQRFSRGEPESLEDLTQNYVKAYASLRPEAQAVEQWLATRMRQTQAPNQPSLAQLDQALLARLQEARAQAIPLRQGFEQPQLLAREEQLASIEKRLGHDQHWLTLRFMLLARQTINALDAMADGASMNPQQLLDMQQSLATRWVDADAFVQALPRLRSANGGPPLWNAISRASQDWIIDLGRLRQHWAAGADATQLNQDLAAARAGYDELQSRYNKAVARQY